MNEIELLQSKKLRDSLAERYDVLEKVKDLLLLDGCDVSTLNQVAEFYEVDNSVIKMVLQNHGNEIEEDGLLRLTGTETREFLAGKTNLPHKIINKRGYFTYGNLQLNNKLNTLFSRRAILRVGMLLRDSKIAKEVRTQLLNIEGKSSVETKVADVNEEQRIALEIGMAYASGNPDTILLATAKLVDFKNRHIKKLEEEKEVLAKGNLAWSDRSKLNFAVRKYSLLTKDGFGVVWNELYKELKYKYGIDLKARGSKNFIQYIKESEWDSVIKTFASMCELKGYNCVDMFDGK